MSQSESAKREKRLEAGNFLRLVGVFLAIVISVIGMLVYANFYTANVSELRYCDDPGAAVSNLEVILESDDPLARQSSRSLVVSAKLLFLVPRGAEEALPQYLTRVRNHIAEVCEGRVSDD